MNKSEKFWNRIAENYNKSERKDVKSFNNLMSKVKENLKPDDIVLDFACGTGSISFEIADSVKKIHAIDTSSKMVEIAKRNIANSHVKNIIFEHLPITYKGLSKTKYDSVLAFNILHLLKETKSTIERIQELLKPGGLFISSTPCLGEKYSIIFGFLSLFSKIGVIPYVRTLKFTQLKNLIMKSGFKIVEWEKIDSSNCFIIAKRFV